MGKIKQAKKKDPTSNFNWFSTKLRYENDELVYRFVFLMHHNSNETNQKIIDKIFGCNR